MMTVKRLNSTLLPKQEDLTLWVSPQLADPEAVTHINNIKLPLLLSDQFTSLFSCDGLTLRCKVQEDLR